MDAPESLVLDLLRTLEGGERPYVEVMAAWRTSCPRLPVWEDALDEGLVVRVGPLVALTEEGRKRLGSQA